FIHDALIRRRMWTPEGIRPIVTVTGSHQRTCVFGTITIDGKQIFRQYDVFNQPKGSSDYNAVEECWRQGKDDLLVSKYYPKFLNLKKRYSQLL
ncbi:MAG: hypothetical protein WCC17_05645, partial [Candidatus Nitrosopolaris sp.]